MTPSHPHFKIYHLKLVLVEDMASKYDALSVYTDSPHTEVDHPHPK